MEDAYLDTYWEDRNEAMFFVDPWDIEGEVMAAQWDEPDFF